MENKVNETKFSIKDKMNELISLIDERLDFICSTALSISVDIGNSAPFLKSKDEIMEEIIELNAKSIKYQEAVSNLNDLRITLYHFMQCQNLDCTCESVIDIVKCRRNLQRLKDSANGWKKA